jgi:3-vinyl bacteriochlorophyllide hydratase
LSGSQSGVKAMRQLKANRLVHDVVLAPRIPSPSHHRHRTLSNSLYTCCDAQFTFATDPSLWRNLRHLSGNAPEGAAPNDRQSLYSAEEKRRRDATPWTVVQGVLAPVQFLAFLVSLGLVLRYLVTGDGLWIATCSIVIKTLLLYAIMITGSIWERVVFGRYLFAPAFFWEDVFSMLVLALHTAYLAAIIWRIGSAEQQMLLVLAAYASYAINATQFLLKLRAARLQDRDTRLQADAAAGGLK